MFATQLYLQDSHAQFLLRTRLDATLDQKKLFAALDADPELVGAGVVYIDSHYTRVELRPFKAICRIKPIKVILREPPQPMSSLDFAADLAARPQESRVIVEALSTALACGAAVLGWIVVFGSGTTVPLTGGASGALTVIGYSAATASTLQCASGVFRTHNAVTDPAVNDRLDSEEWYQNAATALDAISLGGAAAAGMLTIRSVKLLSNQGVGIREALNGLGRTQRKRLIIEIIRLNHPLASNGMIKYMRLAGQYPNRYTATQMAYATKQRIKDSLGALFSLAGSGVNGIARNLAVGIYEEID